MKGSCNSDDDSYPASQRIHVGSLRIRPSMECRVFIAMMLTVWQENGIFKFSFRHSVQNVRTVTVHRRYSNGYVRPYLLH